MKKRYSLILLTILTTAGCGSNSSHISSSSFSSSLINSSTDIVSSSMSEPTFSSESISSDSSKEDSSSSSSSSSFNYDDLPYVDDLIWFPNLEIEVEQRQYIDNYIRENDDAKIMIPCPDMLEVVDNYLVGKKSGDTFIVYKAKGKYQKIFVSIKEKGTFSRAYNFSKSLLAGKTVAVLGDSVAADATVGDEVSVYPRRFAQKFDMTFFDNYAIGGTTGSYPSFNANIMKEYGGIYFDTDMEITKNIDQLLKDDTFTWVSQDTNVATVDQDGTIVGTGIGEAKIIAKSTADPSAFDEARISVFSTPTKVDLFFMDKSTMQPTNLQLNK